MIARKYIIWTLPALAIITLLYGYSYNVLKTNTETEPVLSPAFMDKTIKPGDDFYKYANGTWIKNNPIPEQYSRYSSFEKLQELNLKQLRYLFENVVNLPENNSIIHKKIGNFYNSGIDSAKIEAIGISLIKKELVKISEIKTIKEVQLQIALFHTIGVNSLFYILPGQDKKNSSMIITQLNQGGLGLPNRDYYSGEDSRSTEVRNKYLSYITRMFEISGTNTESAKKIAHTVIKIETRLANASLTLLEQRNPERIYNKTDLRTLQKSYPNINWTDYFTAIDLDPKEINIRQVDFFKEINTLMKEIPVNEWISYLKWNLLNESAEYLNNDFVNLKFSFYSTFLSGNIKIQERWKRVLNTSSTLLGEAVGQLYVEKYFPPEAKKKITILVKNLKDALGEHIKKLSWMSDSTKKQALDKLSAMTLKIGYPDIWKDYSGLEIGTESYITNVFLIKKFNFKNELSRINKSVDRSRWSMSPQTINAYYSVSLNEITFPAGILQPPFFDINADDAVNYGAIGVVIGHEMTHGFDEQGRKYDKSGNLGNWWKDEDSEKFGALAGIIIDKFNEYVLLDSLHVNGTLTLSENIADLGGITIALTALNKSLLNSHQKEIDGFTPIQRFFIAYAQLWKLNIRETELIRRIKEDVHATSEARVNGIVYNIPEFYEAFGLTSGKRYIAADKRITIW